jgi:hypothetical protein
MPRDTAQLYQFLNYRSSLLECWQLAGKLHILAGPVCHHLPILLRTSGLSEIVIEAGLASSGARKNLHRQVLDAVKAGARILTGGEIPPAPARRGTPQSRHS